MHHSQNVQQVLAEIDSVLKTGAVSAQEILDQLTGALDPWTLTTTWKFIKSVNRIDQQPKKRLPKRENR